MMESSLDGPSRAISFNPITEALPPADEEALPPASLTLIRTAEAIGSTVGKIVHAGRAISAKLDMRHRADMSAIRDAAGELQRKGAAITSGVSEISGNVMHYVRTHNARDVGHDLEGVAKRYPVQALTLAAAAGFLLERVLQKRHR